jgi:hypothetical protein
MKQSSGVTNAGRVSFKKSIASRRSKVLEICNEAEFQTNNSRNQ